MTLSKFCVQFLATKTLFWQVANFQDQLNSGFSTYPWGTPDKNICGRLSCHFGKRRVYKLPDSWIPDLPLLFHVVKAIREDYYIGETWLNKSRKLGITDKNKNLRFITRFSIYWAASLIVYDFWLEGVLPSVKDSALQPTYISLLPNLDC